MVSINNDITQYCGTTNDSSSQELYTILDYCLSQMKQIY